MTITTVTGTIYREPVIREKVGFAHVQDKDGLRYDLIAFAHNQAMLYAKLAELHVNDNVTVQGEIREGAKSGYASQFYLTAIGDQSPAPNKNADMQKLVDELAVSFAQFRSSIAMYVRSAPGVDEKAQNITRDLHHLQVLVQS